jgi:membrane protein YfhO
LDTREAVTSTAAVDRPQEVGARVGPPSIGRVPALDIVGVLVSCLIVLIAFSPVVLAGRTLSTASTTFGTNGSAPFPGRPTPVVVSDFRPDPGASAWQFEPWAEVTHRAYATGEVPLWNPYEGAGTPLAANMQSAVFDPLLLGVNLHPTPLMWDISVIGAFLLGAAAAYLFGRILGMGVVPAIVTSAAFSVSGWFFLYSNNDFCRSYVYLPLLFLFVEVVLRSRRLLPVLGLSVCIAGNIYVGMPEASALVIGSATAYAAARLIQERRRTSLRVSIVRLGGAGLLGLMLAAPLVLLFLQYEPLSFNVHKPGFANGSATQPQWGLLNWLVPFFQQGSSVGRLSGVLNWFGVAVGISALAAMSGRAVTKSLHTWLFVAIGTAVLLKIYEFRVFGWVGRLPIVEQIVFPTFAPAVASFAFAVLAGIGVQVLWSRELQLRRFLTLLAVSAVLLVVFVCTGDRWSVITSASRDHAAATWAWAGCIAVLATAAVLLAAWRGRRWAPLLLAALIVGELLVLAPRSNYALRADPFVTPGWMPYVRTALASEPHSRVFALDGKLYPNTAGALGLQDIRMLDGLYVERYLRYVKTFLAPGIFDRFTGTETPVVFRDNPMFDALSVRAVLSQGNLGGGSALRSLGRDGDTRIYENTRAYPRAWVVHNVHLVGGEDDAFRYLEMHARRRNGAFVVDTFDPRRQAVVEVGATNTNRALDVVEGPRRACGGAARDDVEIEHYSAGSATLRVDAACSGLLVLPDAYFPGWKATVNGREAAIYPTNGAFRGVIVPKGTSRVQFRYEPREFTAGIVLALVGLAVFTVVALVCWRRRRSPRMEPSPTAGRA